MKKDCNFEDVYKYIGKLELTHEEKEALDNAVQCYIYNCNKSFNPEQLCFIESVEEQINKNIRLRVME